MRGGKRVIASQRSLPCAHPAIFLFPDGRDSTPRRIVVAGTFDLKAKNPIALVNSETAEGERMRATADKILLQYGQVSIVIVKLGSSAGQARKDFRKMM